MQSGKSKKVRVVGGGASGMIAAIAARRAGAEVTILERNPRIGKKILVTGNGRCNFTNIHTNVENYSGSDPQFALGAITAFGVSETIGFFERLGIAHKVEENGKVFPMSDQASSFLDVLLYELKDLGIHIVCEALVSSIEKKSNNFVIYTAEAGIFQCDKVVLACGGKAMPSTGSDGSGYELAKRLGHSLTAIFPALVQLKLEGGFKQIQGKICGFCRSDFKWCFPQKTEAIFCLQITASRALRSSRSAEKLELLHDKRKPPKISVIDTMNVEELKTSLQRVSAKCPETLEFALVG